ncbi:MAG: hypothetical protein AAGI01_14010, partial [Myxococcota bacterium]
ASSRARERARELARFGTRFGLLASDHQGFVSGADRVRARHVLWCCEGVRKGDAGFLVRSDEIPEEWGPYLGDVVRPVLRAKSCVANAVLLEPVGEQWVIFLDEDVGDEALLGPLGVHLGRLRPVLERRREVAMGRMPWYRLHWPRDARAQLGPKLVVPRRAASASFTLDLSASMVSSDCTFVTAPAQCPDPILHLAWVMVAMNAPWVGVAMQAVGKRKGTLWEFYSEPLARMPLPLVVAGGVATLAPRWADTAEGVALAEQVDAIMEAVYGSSSGGHTSA